MARRDETRQPRRGGVLHRDAAAASVWAAIVQLRVMHHQPVFQGDGFTV
jgi:hypothetical protein